MMGSFFFETDSLSERLILILVLENLFFKEENV